MWYHEVNEQNISDASLMLCKCGKWFLKYKMHIKRNKACERYRFGRFQCSLCMRRFSEEYRLSDHQRSTCHKGINELESDTIEDTFDMLLSSMYGLRIGRISSAFSGMSLSMSTDIYTITRRDDLQSFIADNIQSDSLFKDCCGEIINTLVLWLQDDNVPGKLKPRRIIKTGSLGKGTAVKGTADIDLVMMLAEYDDVLNLMRDLDDLLKQLEKYLVSKTIARHQRTTRYSVQVEVTCTSGHKRDVDILPAVDLLGLDFTPDDVYKKMEIVPADIIYEYSVTLTPLQRDIIGALPTKVKNLIKLVKYWKDRKLKERDEPKRPSFNEKRTNWPNSYALELVVTNAWSEAKRPINFDIVRALHAVLTSLVNHRKFEVVLYREMKYNKDMLKSRSPPFIMDPANPFNDMYHGVPGGKAFDWDSVVPEARRWLGKSLFDGIRDTESNW